MSDADDDFTKAFEGFGEDPAPVNPPTAEDPNKNDKPTPEETPEKTPEAPESPADPKKAEEEKDKPTEAPAGTEENNKPEEKKPEPPKGSETPPETAPVEEPKPLTKDDVTSIIRNIQTEERTSTRELESTTDEVLEAYYPDGLSNTLIDQTTGKELKTPQDVVDVSDGQMTIEQATQWLMNEQYKLDQSVSQIKNDAKKIAETTISFKRDSVLALQKYEPLFKAYPQLQEKVFNKLMKQVKADTEKGVILSAPDVMEHYDDYLEPYQQAYEFSTQQSATNPTAKPEPPKPGTDDRMDISGDGGTTAPDDPNDFAQQVSKELSKGM